jgi:hypothetical protein
MKERQKDRETERQRDRETERQRDRETERQRDRKKDRTFSQNKFCFPSEWIEDDKFLVKRSFTNGKLVIMNLKTIVLISIKG